MYNRAIIITDQDVQPEEFSYPLYRLIEAGVDVDLWLTGSLDATDKSGTGLRTLYNKSYPSKEIRVAADFRNYDIVILPGGFAPERVRLNLSVIEFVNNAVYNGSIVGAICHGPQILISANVCKTIEMTCFIGVKDDLINAGAVYMGPGTFVDGNIVTSDHYRENPKWMKAILDLNAKKILTEYVGH